MSDTSQHPRHAGRAAPSPRASRTGRANVRAAQDTQHLAEPAETPAGERLQKVLAHAGIASRRHAEELIAAGRVSVNGAPVRKLGTRVDPARDDIRVDDQPLRPAAHHTYLVLHKPVGPVTTSHDPQGRQTVLDLLPDELRARRLYPVGRLDRDTAGLLLLTDDGELALRLTHPRYALPKEYEALVVGVPSPAALDRLRQGVQLPGEARPTATARVWTLRQEGADTWLAVELHEGRNRQVRRMLEAVGHSVRRLRRVRVGPLELGELRAGEWRPLRASELRALRRAVGLPERTGA
jgi:23S rRNA pseudouridine2605 synthase